MNRRTTFEVITLVVVAACRTEPVELLGPPRNTSADPAPDVPTASTVTYLGTFPGFTGAIARTVNGSGLAAGGVFGGFVPFLGVVFAAQVDTIPADSGNYVVEVLGINDAGAMTGQSFRGAFVYAPGGVADTLPSQPGYPSYLGADISNHGDIVGLSRYSLEGRLYPRATLWRKTGSGYTVVDLGLFEGAPTEATSIAPNLTGADVLVAGHVDAASRHAFIWQNGVMTVLPTLPNANSDWTEAYDVADNGMVVGWGHGGVGPSHALLWRGAQVPTSLEPACASRTPSGGSVAYGIARSAAPVNRILVVGTCAARPMVWYGSDQGGFIGALLPLLPGDVAGAAYAVNPSGQIVGVSQGHGGMPTRAVRWTFSPFLVYPPVGEPSCSDCTPSVPEDLPPLSGP